VPLTNWNQTTINGRDYIVIDTSRLLVPLDWDPSSNFFLAVGAPDGDITGLLSGFLAQGDPGTPATLDTAVNLTALDFTDATADSMSLTDLGGGVYQINLTLHKGPTGATGASGTLHGASDLTGTDAAGKIIVSTVGGFQYATQKVGDMYWPATITSVPSGNPGFTMCPVAVPALDFDWRPHINFGTTIIGTGTNVQVDVIARLNNATTGNIVGRGTSLAGQNPPPITMISGPPAGSADSYNKVLAGNAATIYMRTERQSGTDTYTAAATTTYCSVEVRPVP
jgi:hypothetical protein